MEASTFSVCGSVDRPKCRKGHVLEVYVTGSEGYCDVCNGIFSRFANMMATCANYVT